MPSRTFRTTLLRAIAPKLILLAAGAALVTPTLMQQQVRATDAEVMSIRPHVDNSPAALIAEHDCWTGDAPADVVLPGRVVVSVNGVVRVGGSRLVGQALEQVFDGADHGLTVYAFCV